MPTGKRLRYQLIAEADADVTYGAEEAALINELKDKVNLLFADLQKTDQMDSA